MQKEINFVSVLYKKKTKAYPEVDKTNTFGKEKSNCKQSSRYYIVKTSKSLK